MEVDDITVVVPAHDEAELIGQCLAYLSIAAGAVNVPVQVIVVLDACTDGTSEVLGPHVRSLSVQARNVGSARAAGFLRAPRGAGSWYATTDADSRVPSNWLSSQIDSARRHDVFVGTVDVRDWSPRRPGAQPEFQRRYVHASGHRHIHGTSVALAARTYWDVGGFAPVPAHEDVALIDACQRAGSAVDWSDRAPVVTSARHSERTPQGFASYLSALERSLPA